MLIIVWRLSIFSLFVSKTASIALHGCVVNRAMIMHTNAKICRLPIMLPVSAVILQWASLWEECLAELLLLQ